MTKEEQKIALLVHRIKDNCYEVAENLLKEHDKQIRADAIEECIALARAEIDFESQAEQKRFIEFMKQLKEQKND